MSSRSEKVSKQAIIVWAVSVLVYVVAVTGRTSFGVAGVDAIDHFNVDASELAVFTSVQLGVYALAQIPTGLLIDRLGPRKLLVAGALTMALGQLILGLTGSYWVAIIARVLIGAGDATAFLSVMRILPTWFPLHRAPLFMQLTSSFGQLGQFLSAVPFMALLKVSGWTVAFVSLGALGVLIAIFAFVAVKDSPAPEDSPRIKKPQMAPEGASVPAARPSIWSLIKHVAKQPVCWMGYFNHFTMLTPQIVFTFLWGVPMMTLGMGLTPQQAGLVLVVNTIVNMLVGPFHGWISLRAGQNREFVSMLFSTIIMATTLWFFLPESPRSMAAVVILNIIMSALSPAANYGFDTVRESVRRNVIATGTGLSNMGAFSASMVAAQFLGALINSRGSYGWSDFRYAWLALGAVWIAGMIGFALTRFLVGRQRRLNQG